jgi:adenylate cyclase
VMVFTSRYFAAMSRVIMDHHGTVDKFIGDGIMAFWNAPVEDADHVQHCCRAVLACQRKNKELNGKFVREGWPAYQTRFGIHVGDAVVGNIGSADRMNYTALGATINLAARLEGLNKSYGTSVLVTEPVKVRADEDFVFRSVDRIKPKGFAEAFTIYELRHERAIDFGGDTAFCRRWEEVYALIHELDLPRSAALVASFLRSYPNDGVARYHAERLLERPHAPPLAPSGAAAQ